MSHSFQSTPLKRPPAYGIYRWWPENGERWIHPFDIGIVRQLIPGLRVFRREDTHDGYLLVSYGDIRFRAKSTIWFEVDYEGFDVGDYVEIKSRMGKADPFIGRIREMIWNHRYKRIDYYLDRSEKLQVRAYRAEDLEPTDAIAPNSESLNDPDRLGGPILGGSLPKD